MLSSPAQLRVWDNATIKYLAELGAEVLALDISPIEDGPWTPIEVNLGDKASIDSVLEAIGEPVDRLFNVAGVAGGRGKEKPAMMVNFFGLRYLTERLLPVMPTWRGDRQRLIPRRLPVHRRPRRHRANAAHLHHGRGRGMARG